MTRQQFLEKMLVKIEALRECGPSDPLTGVDFSNLLYEIEELVEEFCE